MSMFHMNASYFKEELVGDLGIECELFVLISCPKHADFMASNIA